MRRSASGPVSDVEPEGVSDGESLGGAGDVDGADGVGVPAAVPVGEGNDVPGAVEGVPPRDEPTVPWPAVTDVQAASRAALARSARRTTV